MIYQSILASSLGVDTRVDFLAEAGFLERDLITRAKIFLNQKTYKTNMDVYRIKRTYETMTFHYSTWAYS